MVCVVGAGLGNIKMLTLQAREAILEADVVLSSLRISKELADLNECVKVLSINEIVEYINQAENKEENIVVIATGDVGFYSIASTIKRRVSQETLLEFIPGISSMQYLCSKLLIGYEKIELLSLHGRVVPFVPYVCYNERVFCLTGGVYGVKEMVDELVAWGLGDVTLTVGENLSYDNERIVTKKAKDFVGESFQKLAVVLIENEKFQRPELPLFDEDFTRGKAPMTKQSIRDLSVEQLGILPEDVIYDVGSGTGSVSVSLARRARKGIVYAIEKKDEAYELMGQNIKKFGAKNIRRVKGEAPFDLEEMLPPDKVFIGGSSGNLEEIMAWILEKNEYAVIVVNALTIETIAQATACFKSLEIPYEVTCVNVAQSQKIGGYTMMKGENPIYIMRGVKNGDN